MAGRVFTWCRAGKRACVGYGDGTVKLLDLKTGEVVFSLAGGKTGHNSDVTCMDCHSSDNVVATGSTDCTALIVNVGTGKVRMLSICSAGWLSARPQVNLSPATCPQVNSLGLRLGLGLHDWGKG